MIYGYSSGIVGLRLFPYPDFSPAAAKRFDANRYYNDPAYASNPSTIRPFRVGMTCAFCHVGHHPLNPADDVEFPHWENLSSTIGAQHLRVRIAFGGEVDASNYFYHVLDSQLPGTIDTSLIASDNINNANAMNAIFGLGPRVRRALHNPPEQLCPESEAFPGLWEGSYPGNLPKELLQARDRFEGNPRAVPQVLLDGSDSVGSWIALARVYQNIGSYHQRWIQVHNTVLGIRKQTPFKLADSEGNSVFWHATKLRVDPMTAFFLKSTQPMKLRDAPNGLELGWGRRGPGRVEPESDSPMVDGPVEIDHANDYANGREDDAFDGESWHSSLEQGRAVFARGCIACHSGFQPGVNTELEAAIVDAVLPEDRTELTLSMSDLWRLTRGDGKLPMLYARWAMLAVEQPDFWLDNYLSTDMRIPVSMVGTNSARAMATNAMESRIWEDFASLTYKNLDSVGQIHYRDPFSKATRSFVAPQGGPGYYRVPSLISAWATAPFFHNNALGNFNNDPSVKGRLEAFDDAIGKLLTPGQRLTGHDRATVSGLDDVRVEDLRADGGLIWRTSAPSYLVFRGHQIPGLVQGFTGWSPGLTKYVLPWIPSFALILIGLGLIEAPRLGRFKQWLARRFPKSSDALWPIRWLLSVSLTILAGVLFYLAWRYRAQLNLVDVSSGWRFPWILLQAFLPAFVALCAAVLVVIDQLPGKFWVSRWATMLGLISLAMAIFVGIGFGRSLAGHGGDVRIGPFPQGMPVNLIANMDPGAPPQQTARAIKALADYLSRWHRSPPSSRPGLAEFQREVAPLLLDVSKCPDLVMGRGHDYRFMQDFTEEDKAALVELIKTF